MIEMKVRGHDRHRQRGQGTYHGHNIAVPCARIEQQRALAADEQVAVIALVVPRLADRVGGRVESLDQEVVVKPTAPDRLRRLRSDYRPVLTQQIFGADVRREYGKRRR